MSYSRTHARNLRSRARAKFWITYKGPMTCAHCQVAVSRNFPQDNPQKATVDHIKPLSLGGSNGMKNLRLVCLECNATILNPKWPGHQAGPFKLVPAVKVIQKVSFWEKFKDVIRRSLTKLAQT